MTLKVTQSHRNCR